jgi:hypothetical protein
MRNVINKIKVKYDSQFYELEIVFNMFHNKLNIAISALAPNRAGKMLVPIPLET